MDTVSEELATLARLDWLYTKPRFRVLHAPVTATYDADAWDAEDVTFACGWQAKAAWIPGVFSRIALPRCAKCCDKLGYPRGMGSPKNDAACRVILGLDT